MTSSTNASTIEFGLNPHPRHAQVNPYAGLGKQPQTPGGDGSAEGQGERKRRKSVFSSLKLKKRIIRLVSPFMPSPKTPHPQLKETKSDTALSLPRRPIISSPTLTNDDTTFNNNPIDQPRPQLPPINTYNPTRSRAYSTPFSPEDAAHTGPPRGRQGQEQKKDEKRMLRDGKRSKLEKRASWPMMGPRHVELPLGHKPEEGGEPRIQRMVARIYENPNSAQDSSADLKRLKQALDRDIGFTFNVPSLSVTSESRALPATKPTGDKHRSHTLRLKHRSFKAQNKSGRASLVLSPEAQEALQRQLARLEIRDDALTKSARRLSAMDKIVLQGRGPAKHPHSRPALGRQYSHVSFRDENGKRRLTRVPASGDMSLSPNSPSMASSVRAWKKGTSTGMASALPVIVAGKKERMSMPVMRRTSKGGASVTKVSVKPSHPTSPPPAPEAHTDEWDGNPPSPPAFTHPSVPRLAPMPRPRQRGAPLYNPTHDSPNSKRVNKGRATAPKGYNPPAKVEYGRPGAATLAVDQQGPMYSLYAKF
ncbi:hypothetical protein IAR50_003946 [Cryptococcus sp. DSM 104548]